MVWSSSKILHSPEKEQLGALHNEDVMEATLRARNQTQKSVRGIIPFMQSSGTGKNTPQRCCSEYQIPLGKMDSDRSGILSLWECAISDFSGAL